MSMALLTDLASGKIFLLNGKASIGRSGDNDIVLNDQTVSRHHAMITSTGSGWYISDSNSFNGVEISNFRIPSMEQQGLWEGCQIKLGNTCLRFTTDPEAINKYFAAQKDAEKAISDTPQAAPRSPLADPGTPLAIPRSSLAIPRSSPAIPRSPQANPGTPQVNPGTPQVNPGGVVPGEKKSKKSVIYTIGAVAAVIVLVLTWCLANHFSGNAKMREGDYVAAISTYGKDFLFSKSQRVEAIMLAGEDAFARGDYNAAIEFFSSAGATGKTRWADAVYEQAKCLIENKAFDDAIELLNQISDETRAQEQIGVAQLAKARQQFEAGNIDSAIQLAQMIQNAGYADVTAFLDEVYHFVGNDLFEEDDYQGARDAYRKCVNDPQAKTNAEILDKFIGQDCYEAAVLADSAINGGETDHSREEWLAVLKRFTDNSGMTDINLALVNGAAKNILSEKIAFDNSDVISSFRSEASANYMIGSYSSSNASEFVIDDLNDLYKQCGQNPQGKILIVSQMHSFPDRAESQAVRLDLMNLLPAEYYPRSLEEVEYVVLVTYDYGTMGQYQIITVALREYADVKVLKLPSGSRVYSSARVQGDPAPNSFTYRVAPPEWKSGGAPNMGEQIYSALSSIIK